MNYKNYFPNFTCGECSAYLALDDYPLDQVVEDCCSRCALYMRDIKIIDKNLYIYRNIFIQAKNEIDTFMGKMFSMRNRGMWFESILECCDYIDKEIGD